MTWQPSGEAVSPSTELEVKSLGVGTTAPATEGVIAFKATTTTPVYDVPATLRKGGATVYLTVGTKTATAPGSVIIRPYGLSSSKSQTVLSGDSVTVTNSTGSGTAAVLGARTRAKYGFGVMTPTASVVALTSGVAHQFSTQEDVDVHIQLTAAVAGTAKVTMGAAAAGTTHVVATGLKLLAGSSQLVTVHVPMAWYLVVTVTTVTIKSALVVT